MSLNSLSRGHIRVTRKRALILIAALIPACKVSHNLTTIRFPSERKQRTIQYVANLFVIALFKMMRTQ